MKKLWLYLPVCFLMLPTLMYAKGKPKADTIFTSDGVDVYVRRNRAKKLKLIAELHLVDLESSLMDPARVNLGLNADYFFKRYVSVGANFKGAVYSLQQGFATEKNKTQNELQPFMQGGAGIRIHCYDGKGKAWKKVTLGVYQSLNDDGSSHTSFRFVKAKFPCRHIIGARAGLYYTSTPVSADMNGELLRPDLQGAVNTADGTRFAGHYYTNSYTNGYYIGATRIMNLNARISSNIDTFEKKGQHIAFFREMYADVIIGKTQFEPFRVGGKEYTIDPGADGSFRLSNVGWRIGGRALSTRSPGTLGGWYELGMRPGLWVRGLYFSAGITIAFVKA